MSSIAATDLLTAIGGFNSSSSSAGALRQDRCTAENVGSLDSLTADSVSILSQQILLRMPRTGS